VTVELLNPAGLPAPEIYRQVAVATGTRTVYVSGQVARTADGTPVGAATSRRRWRASARASPTSRR
jgi:enamine deaminase RidA (YjgF/YER057c/UK114 family)